MVARGRVPRRTSIYRLNVLDARSCRRCASGARTSRCSPSTSCGASRCEPGRPCARIAADALAQRSRAYDWPGNVRELRNAIERAVALADSVAIGVSDLPAMLRDDRPPTGQLAVNGAEASMAGNGLREELRSFEETLIRSALERTAGNRREAARLLALPLRTFERKLAALEELAARQRSARRPLS